MIFRTIVGLFSMLIVCSCNQEPSKNALQNKEVPNQHLNRKTGLKIETGVNRGITPNDSLGITDYLIHTTTTITNDSTIPIHLQIALSKEYEFPAICNDNRFKVIMLAIEPNPNSSTLWDAITKGFDDFINTRLENPYILNETLKPGDNCKITIGALYPSHGNCGVFPKAVFSHDNNDLILTCGTQLNQDSSSDPQLEIAVKLAYYYDGYFGHPPDSCFIIPFGQISYPDS